MKSCPCMRLISASRSHGMKRAPEIENHLTRPTHHDKKELSIRLWDKEGKSNETNETRAKDAKLRKRTKQPSVLSAFARAHHFLQATSHYSCSYSYSYYFIHPLDEFLIGNHSYLKFPQSGTPEKLPQWPCASLPPTPHAQIKSASSSLPSLSSIFYLLSLFHQHTPNFFCFFSHSCSLPLIIMYST